MVKVVLAIEGACYVKVFSSSEVKVVSRWGQGSTCCLMVGSRFNLLSHSGVKVQPVVLVGVKVQSVRWQLASTSGPLTFDMKIGT